VIDYPTGDMTITVQAGITWEKLQTILAKENQRLPIDMPWPADATLGGILACNVSGPRRFGFGTLRDYVIGISVINDQGREIKAGGRVVKNVAGYDLCKLFVGSLGTLGIITQVTLKVRPLPEECALILIPSDNPRFPELINLFHASCTRPVCIDLLNEASVRFLNNQAKTQLPQAPWLILIGYEDNRDNVGWQIQQLTRELAIEHIRALDVRIGAATGPIWRALSDFALRPESVFTFQANLPAGTTADFCQRLSTFPTEILVQAHAGNGIVKGHLDHTLNLEAGRELVQKLHEWIPSSGNVVIHRCPALWKKNLPIWGKSRNDGWLMRKVKQTLDPHGIFNPGRFVEGI
jgi:glycolate oxidase FAD binding subunit